MLVLAWLKPPLAFPMVVLIVLFWTGKPVRAALGFAAASACMLAVTIAAVGLNPLGWWAHSLVQFSSDTAVRGNQVSFIGLYVQWAPHTIRAILEGAILAIAVVLTARYWLTHRTQRLRPENSAWLWLVWFLATPYAQYYDAIVLALPVLALLGKDGRGI